MDLSREYFDEKLAGLLTREDAQRFATKQDFESLTSKSDLADLKEGVLALHSEMLTVKTDLAEVKATLTELNDRDLQDSNAFAKDIVQLQKRRQGIETQARFLK